MAATVAGPRAADLRTAKIRCIDGDHTLELRDREVTAERLLRTSRKHSFNPDVDVDWDAPLTPGRFYMPPTMISLYETPLWDTLSLEQRIELSKREICSIASFGITAELALMGALLRHARGVRFDTGHWAYALTEVEDECRHSKMFARMIGKCGLSTHRAPRWLRAASDLAAVVHDPMPMFAGILVVEEFTDALQRTLFPDEDLQTLTRQVSRIHVIEEARHITYAREELKRQVAHAATVRRRGASYSIAHLTRALIGAAVHPSCYTGVGLDPAQAREVAAASPHRRQTLQWMLRKSTSFLHEVGFLDNPARRVWRRAGYLA